MGTERQGEAALGNASVKIRFSKPTSQAEALLPAQCPGGLSYNLLNACREGSCLLLCGCCCSCWSLLGTLHSYLRGPKGAGNSSVSEASGFTRESTPKKVLRT